MAAPMEKIGLRITGKANFFRAFSTEISDEVALTQTAPGRYEAVIEAADPGAWHFEMELQEAPRPCRRRYCGRP